MEGPSCLPRLCLIVMIGLSLLVGGCYPEPVAITTFPPADDNSPITAGPTPRPTEQTSGDPIPTPPTVSATPTVPPSTDTSPPLVTPASSPTAGGSPSAGCVNGWTSPAPGMPEYDEGIAILDGSMGVTGPWTVTEMRYFIGPDAPGIIEPHYEVVERWYVRAFPLSDRPFRGRWLLEKRTDQILGISAVAPWESFGYESPDWTGFVGAGPPETYIGLPGQWSGIPYDFVTGEDDSGQPGLPAEVTDCLAAT